MKRKPYDRMESWQEGTRSNANGGARGRRPSVLENIDGGEEDNEGDEDDSMDMGSRPRRRRSGGSLRAGFVPSFFPNTITSIPLLSFSFLFHSLPCSGTQILPVQEGRAHAAAGQGRVPRERLTSALASSREEILRFSSLVDGGGGTRSTHRYP